MQHIDEHTLELYLLGAPEAEPRRAEIDEHLPVCAGCRLLVEEMRRYHADLAEELEKAEAAPLKESALVRQSRGVVPRGGEFSPPSRYEPKTPIQKLHYYAVRYPAAAAAAGVTAAAGLMGLGMLLMLPFRNLPAAATPEIADTNPAFCTSDFDRMRLEVFNKEQQPLWSEVLEGEGPELKQLAGRRVRLTQVADLDGDGVREVVTIARFAGDTAGDRSHLRIYDGRKKLLKDTSFTLDVPYLDRSYSPYIHLSDVLVLDPETPGKHELLVSGNSLARSPRVLLRLDEGLNAIGSYWHFGDLGPFLAQDVDGDGREEIIAIGENDVDDSGTLGEFPVAVVLDPRRIVGTSRSGASPGFRFGPSEAERYYVAFPATDLDSANNLHASSILIEKVDADKISVAVGSNAVFFHYYLTFGMRVEQVKSNDMLAHAYAEQIAAGKLRTGATREKLESFGRRVRYWDGAEWSRTPTMVRNPSRLP